MKPRVLLFLTLLFVSPIAGQEVLDRVIAIVGDNVILQSELYQYSYSVAIQLGLDPQKDTEKMKMLQAETLENMIVQKVLLEKAEEDSVEVSDRHVEVTLDEQIKQMAQQLGSEEKVEQYFGMSIRQIRREFRNDIKERLLVEAIQNKKNQEVQITRREVEDFYSSRRDSLPEMKESVRISHILMPVEASGPAVEAARKKIDDLKARLDKGEDFVELARQYSEDPGSASSGGDLGLMQRGDLVKEFEEVAYALNPGEISEIVRSRFGFHIIQLIRKVGDKINPRHILVRVDTSPEDAKATVERLTELRKEILDGKLTFSNAAQKYSKDEPTTSKGGDLGWFQVDQFQIPAFKNAVVNLKPGDISEPVSTKFGYHLVRLEERREPRQLDLKADWQQIEQWALTVKRQQEFQKWVADVKKDVYIEIKERG